MDIAQIQNPERNGGRALQAIVQHMREDALVAWAWTPGRRPPTPARGSRKLRPADRRLGGDRGGLSLEEGIGQGGGKAGG